jgi:ABC-type nitrate/sulfonate/bicarbonate transport system permease component
MALQSSSASIVDARPRSLGRRANATIVRGLLLIGLALVLEIYGRWWADPSFFKPPSDILRALFDTVLVDPRIRGAILVVAAEIAIAYLMAIGIGLAIGLAVGTGRLTRTALFPVVLLLYAIPQVPMMPLVVLGFGIGPASKIAFGFTHGIFPVIVSTIAGIRTVNPLHIRAARSMGATHGDVIRHVVFPHMVGVFFTGLRLAMTMTMLGVILAELYVSTTGVGYFTKLFAESASPAPLFALIGVLAVIAITFNELVRLAEHRLTPRKQ